MDRGLGVRCHGDLKQSLLSELAGYLGWDDLNKVEFRCRAILEELRADWQRIVKQMDRASIEQFYDTSLAHLFELIWWHTLTEDRTPLAYVLALDFARRHPGRRYLDFGAGIGSGALLFARHGFDVALADISRRSCSSPNGGCGGAVCGVRSSISRKSTFPRTPSS